MKRTTIVADEELLLQLKDVAQRQGTTVSKVMREALAEYVARHRKPRRLPSFTAIGDSGRSDISQRVDEIIAEDLKTRRSGGKTFH